MTFRLQPEWQEVNSCKDLEERAVQTEGTGSSKALRPSNRLVILSNRMEATVVEESYLK